MRFFSGKPKRSEFDYEAWIQAARSELAAKQLAIAREFGLAASGGHFDADLAEGRLSFYDNEEALRVLASVQIVGTTGWVDWRWAWANAHFPKPFVRHARLAQAFGADHDIAELSNPSVAAGDLQELGWRLTAAVVELSGGLGGFTIPTEAGAIFLTFTSLEHAS